MEHLYELLILACSQSAYGILPGEFKSDCIILYGMICLQPEATEREGESKLLCACTSVAEYLSCHWTAQRKQDE